MTNPTYITTTTRIEFSDREAAFEYAAEAGENVEEWDNVRVCTASPDFMALSFTNERQRIALYEPSGFQI